MNTQLSRLTRRVENMVARAVVWMVDNGKKLQEVQVSIQSDEVRTAERFQQYGFSGVPLAQAEAVLVFPRGIRDHVIAIAVDDRRYRPTTDGPGDVRVYNHLGDYVLLKNDGTIEVVASQAVTVTAPEVTVFASSSVRLETPAVEMTGNLTVNGNVTSGGTVQGNVVRTAGGVQLATHIHSGVTAGGANTGVPV